MLMVEYTFFVIYEIWLTEECESVSSVVIYLSKHVSTYMKLQWNSYIYLSFNQCDFPKVTTIILYWHGE